MEKESVLIHGINVEQLISIIQKVVMAELAAAGSADRNDKLLSPADACKVFQPSISKKTLSRWTEDGLIPMKRIGGRIWYKRSDIIESGVKLIRYKNKPYHLLDRGAISVEEFADRMRET